MGFEFRRPKDFLLPALLVIIDHNHDGDITNDELRFINRTVYTVLDRPYRPRPSVPSQIVYTVLDRQYRPRPSIALILYYINVIYFRDLMYMYDLIDVKEYTDSEFDQARNLRTVHGTRPGRVID